MSNVRALICPPKQFRQFCSIFDLIERREPAPRQYLPREILPDVPVAPATVYWRESKNTSEIAALPGVPEAAVWNTMEVIRNEARQRRTA